LLTADDELASAATELAIAKEEAAEADATAADDELGILPPPVSALDFELEVVPPLLSPPPPPPQAVNTTLMDRAHRVRNA